MSKTRRLTTLSIAVSLAMVLSFLESLLPPLSAVPGIKLGLSNIVTVFLIYTLGERDAALVSAVRVSLSALLFGSAVSFLYSLSGAALSFLLMTLSKRLLPFGTVGVSVIGGVGHNIGQVAAAILIMENAYIAFYLAPLLISGTLAGVAVGAGAGILTRRLKDKITK